MTIIKNGGPLYIKGITIVASGPNVIKEGGLMPTILKSGAIILGCGMNPTME